MTERAGYLDDPMVGTLAVMHLADGFRNQRLCVLPKPIADAALERPVTRRLTVTDAGFFPAAAGHARFRPESAKETIVIVCVSGAGWARIAGAQHRVTAGQVIVLPTGLPHAYGAEDDDPWTIWWCHLRGTDVPELVEATGWTASKPIATLRSPDRAVALLDEIVRGLERDQSPTRLVAVAGAAWKLLTRLAVDRVLPEEGDPLERAMSYLAARLDGSISVPELAAVVGLSPSHLSSLFRRATGGGVLAHHTALRMAEARRLLDTTSMTVSEVAVEVGYDDPFYFSRQFRRLHSVSPTQYRTVRKG